MDESPVMNLEGTICRIKKIKPNGAYELDPIEICVKNTDKFDKIQFAYSWREEHLISIDDSEIDEDDYMMVYAVASSGTFQ